MTVTSLAISFGNLVSPAERYKPNREKLVRLLFVSKAFLDQAQRLLRKLPDWNDHGSTGLELFEQRPRYVIGSAGDQNRVERSNFRPAQVTISRAGVDVVVAKPFELRARPLCQLGINSIVQTSPASSASTAAW